MPVSHDSPSPVMAQDALLERRVAVLRLLKDIEWELSDRYGWTPPAVGNQCAHPDRPVFGTLDAQGQPGCFECVRKSHGIKPQKLRAARLSDTERAWANRDIEADLAREWGDS